MALFKNPEEMFKHRAERMKKEGDAHWSKAKNGGGDYHYNKAKQCYDSAKSNLEKAKESKGKSW